MSQRAQATFSWFAAAGVAWAALCWPQLPPEEASLKPHSQRSAVRAAPLPPPLRAAEQRGSSPPAAASAQQRLGDEASDGAARDAAPLADAYRCILQTKAPSVTDKCFQSLYSYKATILIKNI